MFVKFFRITENTRQYRKFLNVKRPHLVIPDQTASRQTSTISSKSIDKVILFKKALGESLGLGIAGGLGSLFGDLPVFVLDIKPGGRVACDGRIRKVGSNDNAELFINIIQGRLIDINQQ